jgi:serine/threonine protein phosphatase PrpC
MFDQHIFSLSLGDSRSVFGIRNWAGFVPVNLSVDHNTSNDQEVRRVIEEGGVVQPLRNINGQFIGPDRVWNKTLKVPGLQITRAFGDLIGKECGVSGKPGMCLSIF